MPAGTVHSCCSRRQDQGPRVGASVVVIAAGKRGCDGAAEVVIEVSQDPGAGLRRVDAECVMQRWLHELLSWWSRNVG